MNENKRFQNRKPNSDDHKKMDRAAKVTRNFVIGGLVTTPLAFGIKKYGVQGLKTAGTNLLKIVLRK